MKTKYKLIMTTILKTDNLDLIKQDLNNMNFGNIPDINLIIDEGNILIEETHIDNRDTVTYIEIQSEEIVK